MERFITSVVGDLPISFSVKPSVSNFPSQASLKKHRIPDKIFTNFSLFFTLLTDCFSVNSPSFPKLVTTTDTVSVYDDSTTEKRALRKDYIPMEVNHMSKKIIWASMAMLAATWMLGSCSESTPKKPWVNLPDKGYAEADACSACHEDAAGQLKGTRHWAKKDPRSPLATHSCESCHGPGATHVDNKSNKKEEIDMMVFGEESIIPMEQQNSMCLKCHQRDHSSWQASNHGRNEVGCTTCHKVHGNSDKQLKEKELDLCGKCHQDKKFAMQSVSHHPVREGKLECSSCHNPHGTNSEANIKGTSINDLCFKCHAEKRGPFVYDHPPVAEDCATCHEPHGSIHNNLLKANMPFLCQRCHVFSGHTNAYAEQNTAGGTSPSQRMYGSSCMDCHPRIHGSNHPSGKFFNR